MDTFVKGSEAATGSLGVVTVKDLNGTHALVVKRERVQGAGPLGKSAMVSRKFTVPVSELLSVDRYHYQCWKGDIGPGKVLREAIKGE